MSPKAFAMHLLAKVILPHFEATFFLALSTFSKNGCSEILGSVRQPTVNHCHFDKKYQQQLQNNCNNTTPLQVTSHTPTASTLTRNYQAHAHKCRQGMRTVIVLIV
jgi:hypothetical protein